MVVLTFFLFLTGGCQMGHGESRAPNRLSREKSPYLLQHADNPVDWYPWGEEAFQKAKKENKPIFLSIGYSTCHWCHVMEEESFENAEVAKILNEHFVAIKVDREERPDVDNLYMSFVMAMSGSGGWPLSVFLTPERKPFFGGTYFPPEDRWGRAGFKTILLQLASAWKTQEGAIVQSSEAITQALREHGDRSVDQVVKLTEDTLKRATEGLGSQFDSHFGGFGPAPKFPRSHTLSFLLRSWRRWKDPESLAMAEKTLQEMAKGGLHDHLGGGFHRYSTDRQWRISHFEKMLYDQAILAKTYLEAYQITKNAFYAEAARDIFAYVLRELRSPEGAFYSAEDADSAPDSAHPEEKSEGAFYLWRKQEILDILGEEKGELFSFHYGVLPNGNALTDPHEALKDKNVLYIAYSAEETAKTFQKRPEEVETVLSEGRKRLFAEQKKRLRPHLDDKILVDWNGLLISSLAFGSRVLRSPEYREAARSAADFILARLVRKDGRLLHRYRDGEAGILGTLEDYAFLIHGLIDLYEATFDLRYLESAKKLAGGMLELFWEEAEGGFFLTGKDAPELVLRPKEIYDGAIPAGSSVAALDLLRLGRLTMDRSFEEKAEILFDRISSQIAQAPMHYPQLLIALDFAIGPSQELVLAGEQRDPALQEMLQILYEHFLPNKVVLFHPPGEQGEHLESLAPFAASQHQVDGKTTVYVCENYVCRLPTNEPEDFKRLLEQF